MECSALFIGKHLLATEILYVVQNLTVSQWCF